MGYFEFRICPNLSSNQECFDKYLLTILGGSPSSSKPSDLHTRFYPRSGSQTYEIRARLPAGTHITNYFNKKKLNWSKV